MDLIDNFIQYLNEQLNKGLPGIKSQSLMAPNDRKPAEDYLSKIRDYKDSAVMLLLYPSNDGIKILLTLRPAHFGNHAGQVSFPGGKKDVFDETLQQTAIRETYEEIGVMVNNKNVIGKLTALYIPVTNFLVNPFIAYLNEKPDFKVNCEEVDKLIELDIKNLSDISIRKQKEITSSSGFTINAPYFDIEPQIIWGATAMILSEFSVLISDWEQG